MSVLAGCAAPPGGSAVRAQPSRAPAGPAGAVLPAPMPCIGRPGDLVGLVLEGQGSPAGTVVVFGQAFRPGDVPRGTQLAARSADGRPMAAQLDVSVRHPDGSARFGVVSLAAPALGAGARAGAVLAAAREPAAAAPIDLAAALGGRQAVLEIAPSEGGEPWRADLPALLRAAAAADGSRRLWQSGPLATQARVAVPVPPAAVGGATSLRLVADVAARADGTVWLDAWLRNDTAMRPGGGQATYSLRVLLDGREALRVQNLRHWQYSGWGRLLGSAAAGGRPAPAPPLVRPDAAYLAETGAVARYDLTTGVEEALLARMARLMADPAWDAPLGARGLVQNMGTAGGRPDLGPTTMYQAAWIMTGDARAAAFSVGQAETAGVVPWHYWDPGGGADGKGGWLDERRWPGFWSDVRGGKPPKTLLQPLPGDTGWVPDAAHQPDLSYVPHLLTGRRAFLDNLQSQAAWNVTSIWPAVRGVRGETGPAQGVLVVNARQVRSAAWAIRQLDEAAWITPDGDSNQPYLRDIAAANWAWLRAQIPAWTALQGEAHGWLLPTDYGHAGVLAPWQQDYVASSAAAAARRGNEDARAFLAWMGNFLTGRFLSEAKGFARKDGVAWAVAMVPIPVTGQRPPPYKTWAEIGEATRARGHSNGDGWAKSQGEYSRLALQGLASLQDITGSEQARQAYAWLFASGAPFVQPQDHARVPTLNIVPRGQPRVPAQAVRCAGSGAARG